MTMAEYQNTIYRTINYINCRENMKFLSINSLGDDNQVVYIVYTHHIDKQWVVLHFNIELNSHYYRLYITDIHNNYLTSERMISEYDQTPIDYDKIDRTIISLVTHSSIEVESRLYSGDMK